MLITGIILGLTAAIMQSLAYLPSRWYVLRRPKSLAQLLAIAHVIQGTVSIPLLWYFWPADMPDVSVYWKPILAESLFYFVGQAGLFTALRYTDASRVSPLLGVKVVILAILSSLFMGQMLTPVQWFAVVLAVFAAFVLNRSGGSIPWRAGAGLLMAWTGYSLSDFFIRVYIEQMTPMAPIKASLLGMYMSYLLCGFVGVAMLPWYGSRNWRDWRDAAPFAFSWYIAMLFFYGALAAAGLVLAAILQSTRSLWSLVIGALLAHHGFHALEQKVAKGVLLRRAVGAVMMVIAITLYVMQSHQKANAIDAQDDVPAATQPAVTQSALLP